jgi:hypothetical protein
MRLRLRYLLSFFGLLILVGFCDCYPITILKSNYLKQTEWIIYQNDRRKRERCYHLQKSACSIISIKSATNYFKDYNKTYDQELLTAFLSQIKIYKNRILITSFRKRIYFPRLSIDGYNLTHKRNEILSSSKSIVKNVCNHLLSRTWIVQRKSPKGKEKDVSDGCLIGFLYLWLLQ